MGKDHRYQGANQVGRWRRHAGRRRPLRRLPRPLLGLIFLSVGTLAATITQFVIQSTASLQSRITNWTEPLPGSMEGRASVIDGDTVEISGQRIRFNGIDAPESRQYCDDAKGFEYPCGRRAADALDTFLAASRPLHCTFVDRDRYGRLVGDCERADGRGVQQWLVEQGLALDWPKYSSGIYASLQAAAKASKRGIWAGSFQAPWEWRAEHSENPRPAISQPLGIISDRQLAQGFACQPRRTCSQISSCDEANWYLGNCSWGGKLDRDKDGIACETLC
ncbi:MULTISPECIES: thermonuclease family protein [Mesorhizobium]|uniref:thermonuclease family protein n=1 Tax=Mesorhizobium TaxID=68287 RepID=UPI00098763EA|nr:MULTISPECIES: thermonuclease family protein [Mesorhizobium]